MTARLASWEARVMLTRTALVASVVLAWQVLPTIGVIDSLSLVPLSDAVASSVELISSGEVVPDMVSTGLTILVSFVIAAAVGLASGFLLWRYPVPYRLLSPYLTSYYALPIIVFYPALIAIFGLTVLPVIAIAAGWAVVAVIVSTVTGLSGVRPVYHKVVRVYHLGAWQAMRRVYVPAAAPLIFNGLRLAVSYAIIGVIAAEFVLAPGDGLGYLVGFYYNNFNVEDMYGVVLIIIVLATTATTLVSWLERRFGGQG